MMKIFLFLKPLLCCERMTVILSNPTKPPTTPLSFCLSRDHRTHTQTVGRMWGGCKANIYAADKNNALADVLTHSPLQPGWHYSELGVHGSLPHSGWSTGEGQWRVSHCHLQSWWGRVCEWSQWRRPRTGSEDNSDTPHMCSEEPRRGGLLTWWLPTLMVMSRNFLTHWQTALVFASTWQSSSLLKQLQTSDVHLASIHFEWPLTAMKMFPPTNSRWSLAHSLESNLTAGEDYTPWHFRHNDLTVFSMYWSWPLHICPCWSLHPREQLASLVEGQQFWFVNHNTPLLREGSIHFKTNYQSSHVKMLHTRAK